MTLLTPLTGLILAAAVIPPLIFLYFLKLRRRTQPIGSTLLWRRSVEDLQANVPFQRLRWSVLLLLQFLVLMLLAAAVAQPRLHAGSRRGGKMVVLIDNSASMTATDGPKGRSRLDEAKELARERVESLYGGGLLGGSPGETMVIAFSDRAEVMCRFTRAKQQILQAIDRVQPTHGETRIDEALRLARAYTTNVVDNMGEARPMGEPAQLELFSDGRIEDLADQVLRGEQLDYYPMGSAGTGNIAITSLSVERPYDQPTAVQVFVALANYGGEEAVCDVQLAVDGVALKIEEVKIGPAEPDPSTGVLLPGRNNVVFSPFELPRGAVVEVANLREDALVADNVAQLVIPPPKRLAVFVVAPGGDLVTMALEGLTLEVLDRTTSGEEYERMAEAGELDAYDLVVLDGYQPKQMPPGRYLIFGPPPPLEGLNPYGTGNDQMALEWRDDHPAMRFVNLDNLYVAKFELIQPDEDVEVLAEGSRTPLIVAISRGPMQVIYCPFDPLDSRWPFDRSWVHFMLNTVDYLGNFGQGLVSQGYHPGEALSARLPSGASDIVLRTPDGQELSQQPLDPTLWSWGPARLGGVYEVSWTEPGRSDRQRRFFAVNLISSTEGDLPPAPEIRIGQDNVKGVAGDDATYTPLWPWALSLCLGLLMIEWWVYHRKTMI